jgi:hypothetical protein
MKRSDWGLRRGYSPCFQPERLNGMPLPMKCSDWGAGEGGVCVILYPGRCRWAGIWQAFGVPRGPPVAALHREGHPVQPFRLETGGVSVSQPPIATLHWGLFIFNPSDWGVRQIEMHRLERDAGTNVRMNCLIGIFSHSHILPLARVDSS